MIDLTKLTPAPWEASDEGYDRRWGVHSKNWLHIGIAHHPDSPNYEEQHGKEQADAEFIALARNAFGVMMRMRWSPFRILEGWKIDSGKAGCMAGEFEAWLRGVSWPDPFTALVEADKWHRENVEENR